MKNRLNLGKIALLLLLPIFIYASGVKAYVDNTNATKGSIINYAIEAEGRDIEFPKIEKIDGLSILGVSTGTKISILNGNYSKILTREYRVRVDKNVTIPSFTVKIDGKEYKTKPIELKVTNQPTATLSGAKVELIASKTTAFVGESIELNIKLFLPKSVAKYQIERPDIKDFWVKQIGEPTKHILASGAVIEYKFLLTPQKSGKLTIGPVAIDIAKVVKNSNSPFGDDEFFNIFTQSLNWQKIYSNKLEFNISPLPQNLEVAGEFDFKVTANTTKVKAGKPVNLTVKIRGKGNLEDIKKFNLDLPSAVVYADEPQTKTSVQNGVEVGEFTQKIAVVADSNITIPSLTFKYFDLNKKEIVTKKSEPIKIEVIGGVKSSTPTKIESAAPTKKEPEIKSKEVIKSVYKEKNGYLKYLFLLIGFIAGAVLVFAIFKLKEGKKTKKELPIVKQIKKAKNDKELFKVLLPYAKEAKIIENTLQKLEENIYKNAKNSIDKSKVIEYFEDKEL